MREAFFGSLVAWNGGADAGPEHQLDGLSFLDLFAGTGAMGLEAASRGAGPVVLVESDQRAAAIIRQNLAATKLDAAVRSAKVETFIDVPPAERFDLIFLDPPYRYATAALVTIITRLLKDWLVTDGAVVVERDARSEPIVLDGVEQWDRKHGETVLTWICPQRGEQSEPSTNHTPSGTDEAAPSGAEQGAPA